MQNLKKNINIRLVCCLERNNKISVYQSGLRQRSTTDPLVQLENTIRQEMVKKRRKILVFFDIQKAYDSAWNHYIIKKLQQYDLMGHLVHFAKNFLSNRQINVRINGSYSEIVNLYTGIPQESVLNCPCFMITINEIANSLLLGLYKTIYVDIFAVY